MRFRRSRTICGARLRDDARLGLIEAGRSVAEMVRHGLFGPDGDADHQRGDGVNRVVYDVTSKPPGNDRVGVRGSTVE
jgi:hypothetical protein